jgi:hypothetical protein
MNAPINPDHAGLLAAILSKFLGNDLSTQRQRILIAVLERDCEQTEDRGEE